MCGLHYSNIGVFVPLKHGDSDKVYFIGIMCVFVLSDLSIPAGESFQTR